MSVIIVAASTLTACFTIRYDTRRTPQISGILFDGGAPQRHEYIILSTERYRPFVTNGAVDCRNVAAITRTDDAGNFAFDAVDEKVTVNNPWDVQPGAYWSICIERDGVRRTLVRQIDRSGQVPASLKMRCDLADPAEIPFGGSPPVTGYCKVVSP